MNREVIQKIKNFLKYKGLKAKASALIFWFQKRYTGKYYSQHGQDKLLVKKLFPGKRNGIFVDIGANDGVTFSNTYLLEKSGWGGLAVEPIPSVYDDLVGNRNCTTINACVAPESGTATFRVISGDAQMLSGLVDKYDAEHVTRIENELETRGGAFEDIEVECFTFNELLERHNISRVDYLTIDVEGAELSILESIDYNRTIISVISIENNYADRRIADFLTGKGFVFHTRVGKDEFYRRDALH